MNEKYLNLIRESLITIKSLIIKINQLQQENDELKQRLS